MVGCVNVVKVYQDIDPTVTAKNKTHSVKLHK